MRNANTTIVASVLSIVIVSAFIAILLRVRRDGEGDEQESRDGPAHNRVVKEGSDADAGQAGVEEHHDEQAFERFLVHIIGC